MLVEAPSELVNLKSTLDSELEEIERALEDTESDELLDQQRAVRDRLDQVEEQLVAFVGFETEHKALAGCFVSIGQDGTPFIEKGLVRPEHRKQLAKLLKTDDGDGEPARTKPKGALSGTLQRDLADARLRIAQVEIAKHPMVALDLLIFQVAVTLLDTRTTDDGADVQFKRPRLQSPGTMEGDIAGNAFEAIANSLSLDWLKPQGEAARFEAFRSLPDEAKLDVLAYCLALTLKPKLPPTTVDEATAYDMALSLTTASVADYWRPTKDNCLGRLTREQLLTITREVFGDAWSQSHMSEKKALLVDQLHRAFSDPDKSGRTSGQIDKLKSWLPEGMSFDIVACTKPAKIRKIRKAA